MGACRETLSVRRNPRALLRWRTWKWNWRLVVQDNLAWLVCAVVGHLPYNTSTIYDSPEHACARCGQWLPEFNPAEWTCHRHGGMPYRVKDGCRQCRDESPVVPLSALLGRRK